MSGPLAEQFFQISVDGETIAGAIHKPLQADPLGVVICLHGFNGDRVDSHRMLVKAGRIWTYHSLITVRFDFRGCGLSDGEFWRTTPTTRARDALAVADFVARRYPSLPISFLGFSDGCRVALQVVQTVTATALILWSPILRMESTESEGSHWQRHPMDHQVVRPFLGHWVGYPYVREAAKYRVPERFTIPSLVLYGTHDPTVRPALADLADRGTNFLEIPDAEHTFSRPTHEAAVIQRTVEFVDTVLQHGKRGVPL